MMRIDRRCKEEIVATLIVVALMLLAGWLWAWVAPAVAADHSEVVRDMVRIPHDAARHRADLTRSARLAWGLDAPLATFAAQIHQESAWRADARSHVGAMGLAQFMPETERWIAGVYPRELAEADAGNPVWAMRAMARYDRWIWERVSFSSGVSDCRRMAATLRGYNGGLGWVLKEARTAQPCEVFRTAAACRENLDYPRRILGVLEPAYVRAGWGNGVCG